MNVHYLNTLLYPLKILLHPPKWYHLNVNFTQQNILNQPVAGKISSLFREDLYFLFLETTLKLEKIMAFRTKDIFLGGRLQREDIASQKFSSDYVLEKKDEVNSNLVLYDWPNFIRILPLILSLVLFQVNLSQAAFRI